VRVVSVCAVLCNSKKKVNKSFVHIAVNWIKSIYYSNRKARALIKHDNYCTCTIIRLFSMLEQACTLFNYAQGVSASR
jgi:hypothetical protein